MKKLIFPISNSIIPREFFLQNFGDHANKKTGSVMQERENSYDQSTKMVFYSMLILKTKIRINAQFHLSEQ